MLGLDRFWIEVVLVTLMLAAVAGWWQEHNLHQRTLGATACLASTTESKETAALNTAAIDARHATTLQKVSDAYITQIAALNADRDSLADRLRNTPAPAGGRPVPALSRPAGGVRSPAADTRLADCTRQRAADAEAGARAVAEVNAMRQAWADLAAKQP